MDGQNPDTIWISSITLFEARYGIELLTSGRRREFLSDRLGELLRYALRNRIKYFDDVSAAEAAKLAAHRRATGRPVDMRDLFIAGIALVTRATIVTRNTRHFSDLEIPLLNPWDEPLVT